MKLNSKAFGVATIATLLLVGGLIAAYGVQIPLNSLVVTLVLVVGVWVCALLVTRSGGAR